MEKKKWTNEAFDQLCFEVLDASSIIILRELAAFDITPAAAARVAMAVHATLAAVCESANKFNFEVLDNNLRSGARNGRERILKPRLKTKRSSINA